MDINSIFPSKYLKASDLNGRRVTVAIEDVTTETVGDDLRAIAHFKGASKGLVLNKTNSNVIADAYGYETTEWIGKPIVLYEARVDFQGKRVPAIRVDIPRQAHPSVGEANFTKAAQKPDEMVPDPLPEVRGSDNPFDDAPPF